MQGHEVVRLGGIEIINNLKYKKINQYLKSLGGNTVPVRLRLWAPLRTIKTITYNLPRISSKTT